MRLSFLIFFLMFDFSEQQQLLCSFATGCFKKFKIPEKPAPELERAPSKREELGRRMASCWLSQKNNEL
ncbi:unnamed protein product [Caenorhabditis angaria]|uniref:Uncharacterized protein n=1 Tax=Caenorhabditis angaria TaxID=860376 RepID=A0A9P1N002_9PELO|nr:unnamed protein product [Caenorhabditis angaria]